MMPHGLVLGFHGCELATARSLALGESELEPSRNGCDWLGEGRYLWVNDMIRGKEWGEERKPRLKSPSVVGVIVELGRCLNLSQRESVEAVAAAFQDLRKTYAFQGRLNEFPKNQGKKRVLDHRVMEHLHYLREIDGKPPYDTVIGYFAEGDPIYEGGDLRHQNHLQVCVRNPDCILGCFLPKQTR